VFSFPNFPVVALPSLSPSSLPQFFWSLPKSNSGGFSWSVLDCVSLPQLGS
jgi:hypothetical protein